MIRARWRTHLRNADSQDRVLEIVRTYLEEWRDDPVAAPALLRPPRLASPHEVVTWALKLSELHAEYVGGLAPTPAALKDFLLFFTHASVRLGELMPASSRSRKMQ